MSFRQYGGINYAARNNIVKNNYTNANNLSVMSKVGQPSSIINVESGLYGIAGDITFQQNNGIPKYGIMFSDGSFQNAAVTSTDSYWTLYTFLPLPAVPTIYYTGTAILGADPIQTEGSIESDVRLAVNGGTAINGNLYVGNGPTNSSGIIYITDNTNIASSEATLRIVADRTNKANYIESGKNNSTGSVADLYFTGINATGTIWMTIKADGKVGIGTPSPSKILEVNGDALINGLTVGKGGGNRTNNTAVGYQALNNNNTNDNGYNNAFGYQALFGNNSGIFNVAVGNFALISNTSGSYNVGIGVQAIATTSTGSYNVALGSRALYLNTSNNNTAIGHWSLYANNSGNNNTAVGYQSMYANTVGSNNTCIGYRADCSINSLSNSTAIGNGTIVTASNQVRIGNTSVTSIGGQVGFTALSDARDKTNFVPLDAGLNFINVLNPVRFDWNQRGGGLEGRKDVGFTAQELLSAQEKTKIPIPNLVDESNPDKYHVMYTQLIPVLVKAVQEMSSTITRLESEINELKLKI